MAPRTERIPVTEAHPTCLHVYRVGGLCGNDKVVKADDRRTPRYYSKGTRLATSWQFALHVGSRHGVLVCHVKSPYVGPPLMPTDPGPISITIGSEGQTVEVHRGTGLSGATYSFRGLDDNEYRWRPRSWLWGSDMECLSSQGRIVARYRTTLFAVSRDGELCIYQSAQFMTDLLVATCLAMRTPDH